MFDQRRSMLIESSKAKMFGIVEHRLRNMHGRGPLVFFVRLLVRPAVLALRLINVKMVLSCFEVVLVL